MLMSLQDKFEFEQLKRWNVVFCISITFLFHQNTFLFVHFISLHEDDDDQMMANRLNIY